MKMLKLLCAAVVFLTACEQKDETISGYVDSDAVWVLEEMNGQPVSKRYTLQFNEPGRVRGEGPCNSFFGEQTKPLPWVDIKVRGATRKACFDLSLESKYFDLLGQATQIEAGEKTLILSDDNGEILVYRRL